MDLTGVETQTRHEGILDQLRCEGRVDVAAPADGCETAQIAIRRDLDHG